MEPKNSLSQITFILTQLFTLVYLGLGFAAIFVSDFLPWLQPWLRVLFGVACIIYAGVRFYRSYAIWKEAQNN
jgi:cytochrome c biogenesis protein CcdA